jgi:hypothetical protein
LLRTKNFRLQLVEQKNIFLQILFVVFLLFCELLCCRG